MKAGWEMRPLGEVADLIARGVAPKYTEGDGVLVLNQRCVRDHQVDFATGRRHDLSKRKVPDERYVRRWDVLVNSTGHGTLGRVAQLRNEPEERSTVDTHVTIVRPTPDLFAPEFFGYAMIAIEDQLAAAGEGASGQTELYRTKIARDFEIGFPTCKEEQRQIVAVLDEAFEGLARARANIEANLADADEIVKAVAVELCHPSLPEIGQAWNEYSLGDICKMYQPQTIGRKDMTEDGEYIVFGANGPIGRYHSYNHENPQLLVTCRGATCGEVNVSTPFSWITGNAMVVIPLDERVAREFLEVLFKYGTNFDEAITGAAQPQITRKSLSPLCVSVPTRDTQHQIVTAIRKAAFAASELRQAYTAQLTDLATLRQSLLARAFRGELT